MNELLYKLADDCRTLYRNGHGEYVEQFDEEKFAELIVKECIDYCGENLSKTVGGALKIHFGIK